MDARDGYCRRFGTAVRRLREKVGISQEELAERAGMHRTYIGGIERGERNPTLVSIHKLAKALGVSPKQLLNNAIKTPS
jgi:transcriptional regulator with XRE-family HTH domain